MLRRSLWLLGLCVTAQAFAADSPSQKAPRDLYLGEAFYYAQQGEYFDAVTRLDTELGQFYRLDERNLDPFHLQSNFAEFSVGDFELSYRMHQRAGRAIKAVLEGNVSQDIKNEAAFRLARIYYQKSEPEMRCTPSSASPARSPTEFATTSSFCARRSTWSTVDSPRPSRSCRG
jgi:hypothetical protein